MKRLLQFVSFGLVITSCMAQCEPPEGESLCDICALMFLDDSEFMMNCGVYMDDLILTFLQKACEGLQENPEQLGVFLDNMRAVCEDKGKGPFQLPECVCDPCELLFEEDSDFILNCGVKLDAITLNKIRGHCSELQLNEAMFEAYLANLEEFCATKNSSFEATDCVCDLCEMLFEENSDFMLNCGVQLDAITLNKIRGHCSELVLDEEMFAAYLANLKEFCATKDGCFKVTDCPRECDMCELLFEDASSDFMQECGIYMDPLILGHLQAACSDLQSDDELFQAFLDNLQAMCEGSEPSSFSDPTCDAISFELTQTCTCPGSCNPESFKCDPVTYQCNCVTCGCTIP